MSEQDVETVGRMHCPESGCPWSSREIDSYGAYLASQVDAALHYVDEHGGEIPEDAEFGDEQCPECYDILGMDGTASCSACGHIPEDERLRADGGRDEDADTVWQCPICLVEVVGEEARDEHAAGEPGLKPSGMVRSR